MSDRIILVIEDNINQQNIFRLLLPKFGFDFLIVESGQAAIDSVACCSPCFAAIIMDLKLPDMNGIDCTRQLRQFEKTKLNKTPIIAVTAQAMPGDRERCLSAGMVDYLAKPFTVDELRRILLRWTYEQGHPNLHLLQAQGE